MRLTLGEAAKATGKSKPTIQRAIKSGKISAEKRDDGSYQIDPSELFRVYDALPRNSNDTPHVKQSVTPSITPETPPNETVGYWKTLHETSERERSRERDQLQATIDDLRARLDASETERRATQARLEDMRDRKGLFGFLRRRD